MKRTRTKQKHSKQPTPLQTDNTQATEPTDRNHTINQSEEQGQLKDQQNKTQAAIQEEELKGGVTKE